MSPFRKENRYTLEPSNKYAILFSSPCKFETFLLNQENEIANIHLALKKLYELKVIEQ